MNLLETGSRPAPHDDEAEDGELAAVVPSITVSPLDDGAHLAAITVEEGLRMAETHGPDLIPMDIQLPGLDGYEVTRRIKANPAFRRIPIVAVASYALSGDDVKVYSRLAGYDDTLTLCPYGKVHPTPPLAPWGNLTRSPGAGVPLTLERNASWATRARGP